MGYDLTDVFADASAEFETNLGGLIQSAGYKDWSRQSSGLVTNWAAARRYAALGYPVFPCRVGRKEPRTEHGFKDATTDLDQINNWWSENPQYNIGIATAGFFVLDIDGPDHEWLDKVGEHVNECSQSRTPGGGMHYWFRDAENHFRISVGRLAKHVDTRAGGGYACVAPSVVDGNSYQWLPGYNLGPPDELPDVPKSLADAIEKAASKPVPVVAQSADSMIPEGKRNDTLARKAGEMRRSGFDEPAIRAALLEENKKCRPSPLPAAEVKKIAWSISRYEPDQTTQGMIEGWADGLFGGPDDRPIEPGPIDPGEFPAELLDVPGLMGEVIDFNLATAPRPQPVLALAGAISLMSVITGHRVMTESGNRSNLLILGLGPSACGKDHARALNKRILEGAGLDAMIGPEELASDVGLVSALKANPVCLFQIDEFGHFLRTTQSAGRSPHLYAIPSLMMKIYTSAGSRYKGKAYGDASRNPVLNNPHLVLYGTMVSEGFYESLTPDQLSNGFAGRMLAFEATTIPPLRNIPRQEIPAGIVEQVRAWGEFRPGGNLSDITGESPAAIYADDAATARMLDYQLATDTIVQKNIGVESALMGRAMEKAWKLAMVYQCSLDGIPNHEAGEVIQIGLTAADWACRLVDHLCRRMLLAADRHVAESEGERDRKRILAIVRDAGGDGISSRELSRKTQRIDGKRRKSALEDLVESGIVRPEIIEGNKGRPATVYKA